MGASVVRPSVRARVRTRPAWHVRFACIVGKVSFLACPRCARPRAQLTDYCATCGLVFSPGLQLQDAKVIELAWLSESENRSPAEPPGPSAEQVGPGGLQDEGAAQGFNLEPNYLLGAGYWTLPLVFFIPPLVLVSWAVGVLVILSRRLGAGLWLLFLSSLVASFGVGLWATLFSTPA